jgi:23S rRNA pseudouridine2604 synthase
MGSGVPILDTITKPCFVEQIHKKQFRIILTQGLNRQIRRMCEFLEYRVVELKRVRIMNLKLDTKVGRYRDLTKKEMTELRKLLADSSKHI